MDDGCFAGWSVVAGFEGIFLTSQVAAYVGLMLFQPNIYCANVWGCNKMQSSAA